MTCCFLGADPDQSLPPPTFPGPRNTSFAPSPQFVCFFEGDPRPVPPPISLGVGGAPSTDQFCPHFVQSAWAVRGQSVLSFARVRVEFSEEKSDDAADPPLTVL